MYVQESLKNVNLWDYCRKRKKTFLALFIVFLKGGVTVQKPLKILALPRRGRGGLTLADVPAVFFHIWNFDICHDNYKYQKIEIRVS